MKHIFVTGDNILDFTEILSKTSSTSGDLKVMDFKIKPAHWDLGNYKQEINIL